MDLIEGGDDYEPVSKEELETLDKDALKRKIFGKSSVAAPPAPTAPPAPAAKAPATAEATANEEELSFEDKLFLSLEPEKSDLNSFREACLQHQRDAAGENVDTESKSPKEKGPRKESWDDISSTSSAGEDAALSDAPAPFVNWSDTKSSHASIPSQPLTRTRYCFSPTLEGQYGDPEEWDSLRTIGLEMIEKGEKTMGDYVSGAENRLVKHS